MEARLPPQKLTVPGAAVHGRQLHQRRVVLGHNCQVAGKGHTATYRTPTAVVDVRVEHDAGEASQVLDVGGQVVNDTTLTGIRGVRGADDDGDPGTHRLTFS